jgi:acyl-coenzyme A synthetase/AMP-(fatty) acid ligase
LISANVLIQGDLGRWNSSGCVDFVGRQSRTQIKIRGQRFEMADVEANIARISGMKDVAVTYHQSADNASQGTLLAYLVPSPDSEQWHALQKKERDLVDSWEEHYDESYSKDDV